MRFSVTVQGGISLVGAAAGTEPLLVKLVSDGHEFKFEFKRGGQAIPLAQEVWEATPLQSREFIVSLMGQVATLTQQVLTLQKRLEAMEELTRTNSTNSSKPPSADPPGTLRNRKETSGKSRGGQPGHKGYHREMLPTEKADHVRHHYPPKCAKCSRDLTSVDAVNDSEPVRHQVWEIPPVKAEVTEHQRHRCCCPDCGTVSLAELPPGILKLRSKLEVDL